MASSEGAVGVAASADHEMGNEDDKSLVEVIRNVEGNKAEMSMVFEMLRDYSLQWLPGSSVGDTMREYLQTVNVVTRAEEEAFLRTKVAANGERDCMRGADCEGTRIVGPPGGGGVTLVEHWPQNLPRPEKPVCCMAEGDDMAGVFSSHANIADQEGEYTLAQCVIAGTRETHGALLPCALHCRAWYGYAGMKDGVHRFNQPGYEYPQLFRQLAGAPCRS